MERSQDYARSLRAEMGVGAEEARAILLEEDITGELLLGPRAGRRRTVFWSGVLALSTLCALLGGRRLATSANWGSGAGEGVVVDADLAFVDPPALTPTVDACGLIEDSTDYRARDLPYNMANIGSADVCCRLCQADSDCSAWTWGKEPNIPGLSNVCFFKALVHGEEPHKAVNPNVTSGVTKRAMEKILAARGKADTHTTLPQTTITTTATTAMASLRASHVPAVPKPPTTTTATKTRSMLKIRSAQVNRSLCLDVGDDGESLILMTCEEGKVSQGFSYDGKRGLLQAAAGTCADVAKPSVEATPVKLSECDGRDWGQHWSHGASSLQLQNRHGICMDVAPPYSNGSAVQLWGCDRNGSPTQQWLVEEATAPELAFEGKLSHRVLGDCLDSAAANASGSGVVLVPCSNRTLKGSWRYDGETGTVSNEGVCLSAASPGTSGSDMSLQVCDSKSWNQQWTYDDVLGHIKNRHGLCLSSAAASRRITMERCSKGDEQQFWELDVGSWSSLTPKPPSQWDHPSFFCFEVMRPEGYEPGLIKMQLKRWIGIFLCEEHGIYSMGEPYFLGHGKEGPISTFPIPDLQMSNSMGSLAPGQTTNSWLNTLTFMQVWKAVKNDGRYLNHDWSVKVDPDAVFLRVRLGWHLAPHTNDEALYVKNTNCYPDIMFFGAVESISRAAVARYLKDSQRCMDELPWQGWGEDYYMQHCLDLLGVGHAEDFQMLSDTHCHAVPCNNPDYATFHPYKDIASYEDCLDQVVPGR